jgi:membrane fusion protein (multidrug efflux system)
MIKRFIIAAVLLILVAGGLVGFNMFRDQAIENFFANMPRPTVTVSTTTVESVTWEPTIPAIGTIQANNGVDLSVESAGIVKEILFKANQQIEQGDVLVRLEDEIQRADLEASRTQASLDEQSLRRAQELGRRGVGSQSTLDAAQAAAQASASAVTKAEAALNQKQIRAPFSGTIGIPRLELGQYLQPGSVVATLQNLETMRVDFTVPEQQFAQLEMGQTVHVGLTDDDLRFTGKIIGIDPKIDPATRLVSVRAEITNAEGQLNPGQFARVRVEQPAESDIIAVPQTAVVTSLYGDYIYRLVKSDEEAAEGEEEVFTAEQVFVQVGRRERGIIEIKDNLAVGDVIVNAGQNRLSNGSRVRIDNTVQPIQAGSNAE